MLLSDTTLSKLISIAPNLIKLTSEEKIPTGVTRINEYGQRAISSGYSPFGFDVTLKPEIKRFITPYTYSHRRLDMLMDDNCGVDLPPVDPILNPKAPSSDLMWTDSDPIHDDVHGDYFILAPGEFILGVTNEVIDLPNDLSILCVTKSTYARIAVQVMVTPINAGFKGTVVIEIVNHSPFKAMVFVNEGIAQFMFIQGDQPCADSYNGPYQLQQGIQTSKV